MRTTLTLDEDVVAMLDRLRKTRDESLRDIVNEALRHGLSVMSVPPKKRKPYRTPPLNAGECLIGSVDNISEVLAIAEGENYR